MVDAAGKRTLVGVNSFMVGGQCGEYSVRSGFVSVAHYRNWIDEVRAGR